MTRPAHGGRVRVALLTFVMLAPSVLAAGMGDETHDVVLFGDHAAEATLDEVDLTHGSIEGRDGVYVATLHFVDLPPVPRADDAFRFHAEAQFRADPAGRVLLSYSAEPDGTPFVVAYDEDFDVLGGATAEYDGAADTLTFRLHSPAHTEEPWAAGANAALFHCLPERGCSRAILGPESGIAGASLRDAMGVSQHDAFVRAGL